MNLQPASFAAPQKLGEFYVTEESLPRMCDKVLASARRSGTPVEVKTIGKSRAGREMVGLIIGSGERHVSITAGAHSDEPVGPMTAMRLAAWLVSENEEARNFARRFQFCICPQTNPDGAAINSAWFSDPLVAQKYFENVLREQPGDDIEFGYPANGAAALRPENQAVADFLRAHAPYVYHASLHGMAFAEGAWFLICKEWADRTARLQQLLIQLSAEAQLPLHDIDRRGEKGFTRIAEGFCTTPTSTAMQAYFRERGDEASVSMFRPSSMEFVQFLGGDPLAMVSELPLFQISDPQPRAAGVAPEPGETAYEKFRAALSPARTEYERGNKQPIIDLMHEYRLRPVSLQQQVALQGRMVLAGAAFAAGFL